MEQKAYQLLGLAQRAQSLVAGKDAVLRAMRAGEAKLVILAADISAGNAERVRASCEHHEVFWRQWGEQALLGKALGHRNVGVLAITQAGLAAAVRKAWEAADPEVTQVEKAD